MNAKGKNYFTFAHHLVERTIYFTIHYQLICGKNYLNPNFKIGGGYCAFQPLSIFVYL
jgi:hypothetical protein